MYIVQMKEFSKLPLPKALQDHFAFKAGTIFKVAQKNNSFIFTPLKKTGCAFIRNQLFWLFLCKNCRTRMYLPAKAAENSGIIGLPVHKPRLFYHQIVDCRCPLALSGTHACNG